VGQIYSREELLTLRQRWRHEGRSVVFTNGCYDLLHPGHVRLLEAARSLGDLLVLALNSDAGVARLKGPPAPCLILAAPRWLRPGSRCGNDLR
jgi:cytidyltransferase-like protein